MLTELSADTGFPPLPGTVSRLLLVAGLSGCLPVWSRTLRAGSSLRAGSFPKASARERRLFVLATGHLRPGLLVLLEVRWSGPEPVLVARQSPDARVEEGELLEEVFSLPRQALALVPPGEEDAGIELPLRCLDIQENL